MTYNFLNIINRVKNIILIFFKNIIKYKNNNNNYDILISDIETLGPLFIKSAQIFGHL